MSSKKLNRKKLLEVLKFIIIFNLLAIPMYAVLYFNLSFDPLRSFLAELTTRFLKAIGINIVQENSFVITVCKNPPNAFEILKIDISFDSTGWKTLYALVALVIATPKRKLENKLKFLAIGLPLLFILNFFRIATTILIAASFGCKYFEVVHIFLWREGLIAAVLLIWYLWLRQK